MLSMRKCCMRFVVGVAQGHDRTLTHWLLPFTLCRWPLRRVQYVRSHCCEEICLSQQAQFAQAFTGESEHLMAFARRFGETSDAGLGTCIICAFSMVRNQTSFAAAQLATSFTQIAHARWWTSIGDSKSFRPGIKAVNSVGMHMVFCLPV